MVYLPTKGIMLEDHNLPYKTVLIRKHTYVAINLKRFVYSAAMQNKTICQLWIFIKAGSIELKYGNIP